MITSLPERTSYERELFELGVLKTRGKAGGKTWRLKSKAGGGKTALYVPAAALGQDPGDLVLFIHGDPKPCGNGVDDEAALLVGSSTFAIPTMLDASKAEAVLVAPTMPWSTNKTWHALGAPEKMNAFLAEVQKSLVDAGWASMPSLRRVVMSGHSRAHVVLNALAKAVGDKAWSTGALAKVSDVCLLDTTYGDPSKHCSTWTDFAKAKPSVTLTVGYQTRGDTVRVAECIANAALKNVVVFPEVPPTKESIHCEIPQRVLPKVLARLVP